MKISERIMALAAEECWDDEIEQQLFAIADELDAMEQKPKWFWGRPEKPGLYAFGGLRSDAPWNFTYAEIKDHESFVTARWLAYLGPIPEIEMPDKPKKYRTPILPQDAGKECEFSDDGFKTIHSGKLQAFDSAALDKWVMCACHSFADCRIEVTE